MDEIRPSADSAPEPGSPGTAELPELLRQSSRGDESAFARLYDAVSSKVYGLTLRVVRDPAQAEEVTQEAFLEIWRTAARYRSERGSALAWMLTIAHRRAVDRVRTAESATRREIAYGQRNRPVHHDSTAEAVEDALEARRVRTALDVLTPVQREAVALAYFGGYTHTEIAGMLELPIGTAKTRIRDGLIRLRDTLGVEA